MSVSSKKILSLNQSLNQSMNQLCRYFNSNSTHFIKKIPHYFLKIAILGSIVSCSTTVIEKVVITDPITFNADVKIIISNNCLPCHAGSFAAAGLNLESYENVREATENGNLLASINSMTNPMPQSGLMAPDLILIIEQWASDGYIEN